MDEPWKLDIYSGLPSGKLSQKNNGKIHHFWWEHQRTFDWAMASSSQTVNVIARPGKYRYIPYRFPIIPYRLTSSIPQMVNHQAG